MSWQVNAIRPIKRLRRNVAKVALAAALGVAASAPTAAIIDSGPISINVPHTSAGIYVNLVTGGITATPAVGWDFNPFGSANLGFFPNISAGHTAAIVATAANSGIAAALSAGSTIGPASSYQTSGAAQTTGTAYRTTSTNYVGISFDNEATATLNYGYAQISTTAGTGFPATILRYVYDNTGAPITVTAPPPTSLYAYNRGNNHLVSFDATTPGTLLSDIPLTGLGATEFLLGIDFRPANGLLYGMAANGITERLVTIDTTNGAVASVNGANTVPEFPTAFAFGVDFNPVPDRVRQVSDDDTSIRLNPNNGALAGVDTNLVYAAGDPNAGTDPHVVHVAYTNSMAGAAATTLYGIDTITNSLVTIGGPNGVPSPNTGQLFTVGGLGVDAQDRGGFDIHFGTNIGYAALQVGSFSSLYTINLATGAASLIGTIGSGITVDGLSVAFSTAPKIVAAYSRKIQGAAGTFDLPLSSALANPTTEPRQGPTHTIVMTFNAPVTAATLAINEGTAALGLTSTVGNDLIVPISGVTDGQYVTIAVTNATDVNGNGGGGGLVRVGFLAGDVNQSRVVSIADLGLVNAQLAQPVTGSNYLKDVNASGTLTLADKGITNANLTHALPPP